MERCLKSSNSDLHQAVNIHEGSETSAGGLILFERAVHLGLMNFEQNQFDVLQNHRSVDANLLMFPSFPSFCSTRTVFYELQPFFFLQDRNDVTWCCALKCLTSPEVSGGIRRCHDPCVTVWQVFLQKTSGAKCPGLTSPRINKTFENWSRSTCRHVQRPQQEMNSWMWRCWENAVHRVEYSSAQTGLGFYKEPAQNSSTDVKTKMKTSFILKSSF